MNKKVLILGSSGYIGNALFEYLQNKGYEVKGVDNQMREKNVESIGSKSITNKKYFPFHLLDIVEDKDDFNLLIKTFKPDVIVNLAHQPSAPFSMIDSKHAMETQKNNILGTLSVLYAIKEYCPDAHLIQLGTEGEYSADLWDGKKIPEGSIMKVFLPKENIEFDQDNYDEWEIPTPRYGGSFYHFSKIYSDYNIDYACKLWGIKATNIQQGVIYSHRYNTRLDVDNWFGTIINRFVAQAVLGMPLTVYGTGGQTRGFICLQNSLEAIELFIENPADKGEFRVIHQSTESLNVMDIAKMIQEKTGCEIKCIENPRMEKDKNNFTFDTSTLDNLGLKRIKFEDELPHLIKVMEENKNNIIKDALSIETLTKWK